MHKAVVIIPALNEAKYIGKAVRGARRHIKDVLVVDDGSMDDTARQAKMAGAKVVSLPKKG